MRAPGPRLGAVLAVLLSAAVGYVTNLITSQWNWTLAAVLTVLLAASAVLAAQATATRRDTRTRIQQRAKGGSHIHDSGIRAVGAVSVNQASRRKGIITHSPIDAHSGDVTQTSSRAEISDSPIETDQ